MFLNDDATRVDLLNRSRFARTLASLVLDAPAGSSFRLGIYGGWGEGKTSIMRMMQERIVAAGQRAVFIVPWGAPSQEELTARILTAIADELEISEVTQARVGDKLSSGVAAAWEKVTDLDWKLKLVDKVVGGAIERATDRLKGWQNKRVLEAIAKALSEKKLIVFVDDVDRAAPALVPDLLLSIREALDLPNLFYVIGLSPAIVQEGLTQVHYGWKEPLRFLEKIVEYPLYLSTPTAAERRSYAHALIAENASGVDREMLDGIAHILPPNPRVLKSFLRHLSNLKRQIERFNRDEMALPALYLVHLLLVEFPQEGRDLLHSAADVSWIERYHLHRLKEADESTQSPQIASSISPQSRRDRFILICTALAERMPLVPEYSLTDMAALLERPPVLTWKEAVSLFDQLIEEQIEPTEQRRLIQEWISAEPAEAAIRSRALFQKAIEYHRRAWNFLIEVDTKAEMIRVRSEMGRLISVIHSLIDDFQLFAIEGIGANEWWKLYEHLRDASRFQRPKDLYESMRNDEIRLILSSIRTMPLHTRELVLQKLSEWSPAFEAPPASFRATTQRLRKELSDSIAERLLSRFEEPDGVDILWGDSSPAEKALAFNINSVFYAKHRRTRLRKIAQRAAEDPIVQKNFLTFLRMLCHGATSGGSFSRDDCQLLAKNQTMARLIWRAATARALNPRTAGSLREYRNALIARYGVDEKTLSLPKCGDTWNGNSYGSGAHHPQRRRRQLMMPHPMTSNEDFLAVTERERMLRGELYLATDPELVAARQRARRLWQPLNALPPDAGRLPLLRELLGRVGNGVQIEPPFYCDYGSQVELGDGVFINMNCVFLDCAAITIGAQTFLGPNVQLYTAEHPLDAAERVAGPESARPIAIDARVWIGGGTIVLPGVGIGDETVIGAGSVVTKDVPAGVVAAGNPCRVIRALRAGSS